MEATGGEILNKAEQKGGENGTEWRNKNRRKQGTKRTKKEGGGSKLNKKEGGKGTKLEQNRGISWIN